MSKAETEQARNDDGEALGPEAGIGRKVGARLGIFGTLLSFLWKEKMWWMIPMIIILIGFAALSMLAGSSGIAPFVYTLF